LKKKVLRITLISLLSVIALIVIGFFSLRNYFLNKVIDKAADRFRSGYSATMVVGDARFRGFSAIEMLDFSLVPDNLDTLVKVSRVYTDIQFWPLFKGSIKLDNLEVSGAILNIVRKNGGDNISAFLGNENDSAGRQDTTSEVNFSQTAFDLLETLLDHVPARVSINSMNFLYNDENRETRRHYSAGIEQLEYNNENFSSRLSLTDSIGRQVWLCHGQIEPDDMRGSFHLKAENETLRVPAIRKEFGILMMFDSVSFSLDNVKMEDGELTIQGSGKTRNLVVNHRRLADTDVVIESAEASYKLILGSGTIMLDSSSVVHLNKIAIRPYLRYQAKPVKEYEARIVSGRMPAQEVLNSLPRGMFTHIEGMEVTGFLTYTLDFFLNADRLELDQVVFDSHLKKEDFRILKFGKAMLGKLNQPFVYTPHEYGRAVRSFVVGEENPDFTPVDQVSPYLKNAILTSEDPSFFYHRGFIEEAIKRSIIENYKARRFKQGGSTISMQLVKNVFLTRQKTMARKFEEILLTWLIENNGVSSKQRMFEVYLNIIEWGPNVYGIGEASRFYFNKRPAELTLAESIFLSSIIPSPKLFRYRFDEHGNLRNFMGSLYRMMATKMVIRNMITPEDTIGLMPSIEIMGPARQYFKEKVPPVDTLDVTPDFLD
jgi:hypothetical protein